MADSLDNATHRPRPNPSTHRSVLPSGAREKLSFIVENLNVGITPMRMVFDTDREVDVIAYTITEETTDDEGNPTEEYLFQPIAILVDDNLEAKLSEVQES